jgi:hypothetical protein
LTFRLLCVVSITAGYPTNARSVHDRISSFIDYLQSSTADAGAMSMVMLLLDKVAAADVTVSGNAVISKIHIACYNGVCYNEIITMFFAGIYGAEC